MCAWMWSWTLFWLFLLPRDFWSLKLTFDFELLLDLVDAAGFHLDLLMLKGWFGSGVPPMVFANSLEVAMLGFLFERDALPPSR